MSIADGWVGIKGFDGKPVIIAIQIQRGKGDRISRTNGQGIFWVNGVENLDASFSGDINYIGQQQLYFSLRGNSFSYYSDSQYESDSIQYQLNEQGATYVYIGILI